ncbi:MAG TPA: hypothetical protein VMM13_00790, partial [Euzebya sp.]|nr:hypothetical protein [Euzebya sp.]
VRGNPWDFAPGGLVAGTDDIIEMGNATRVEGPGLTAVNSNTTGDPHILLDVPTPIDSRAFQTITVHFTIDGPFDLSYDPGGGTHGRILYQHGHNTPWRDGNDIVAYPTQTSYTVDMTAVAALEPGAPAWDSAPVTGLRFDPNEDPGAGRRWTVTAIELTP